MTPKLTLVGAGPGDGELITLKGIRALEQADVVLYDDLANQALLDYCPEHTLKIYVGKRAGRSTSFKQEEINTLIVRLAHKRGHVVRLKGGDPLVFGRGHEETEHAQRHGIACVIVPGISSCIAVPTSQNIPVTRRGVSESFWVITGTTRNGELSEDLHLAAQSNATIVVLMGLKKLSEICALYVQLGRGHMPVAIIQNGTRNDEICVVGQAWEMPQLIKDYDAKGSIGVGAPISGLNGPAVIVIGEVVALHPAYMLEYLQSLPMVA